MHRLLVDLTKLFRHMRITSRNLNQAISAHRSQIRSASWTSRRIDNGVTITLQYSLTRTRQSRARGYGISQLTTISINNEQSNNSLKFFCGSKTRSPIAITPHGPSSDLIFFQNTISISRDLASSLRLSNRLYKLRAHRFEFFATCGTS